VIDAIYFLQQLFLQSGLHLVVAVGERHIIISTTSASNENGALSIHNILGNLEVVFS